MTDATDTRDLLLCDLADEFAARHRAGERPRLEEYCDRHPDLADDIRAIFPAMIEMERAKVDVGPASAKAGDAPPLRCLGDFRLLREVGRGGMGVVYEAEQVSLGRRVAIKLLPDTLFRDTVQRWRFEREAKAAARLHHSNIVPVHGYGEHDGTPYYVMQFIPGLGLDAVIEELARSPIDGRTPKPSGGSAALSAAIAHSLFTADAGTATGPGPATPAPAKPAVGETTSGLSVSPGGSGTHLFGQSGSAPGGSVGQKATFWQSVARIGVQVAGALAYAHKLGVLHRDIKPGNLLLDLDGVVWVTDFGLAKAEDSVNLTRTGDLLGTLRYMPPEAFDGKSDARSDVYALGLTLYELVALRPAHMERDRNRLIKQVTSGDPPRLGLVRRDAPRDLVTVIEKATDKDPARRYQTAAELADDLQRFLDGRSILARRAGVAEKVGRWARRNPGVAAAALAVVAALSLGTTVSYLKYREAERQHGIAERHLAEAEKQEGIARLRERDATREAEKARKASDFLISVFRVSERDTHGGNITARQILADAERRIPVEFADQPELRAELVAAVGRVKRDIARQVPQAMILEASGGVRLVSAAGAAKPAVPQALVNLDDRLTLSADARVRLVFLSDFHQERLRPDRTVTIDDKGGVPADAVLERDAGVLMTFARLPKGTFHMGWDGQKKGVPTDIPEDFEMATHLVTQGQWEAIMGDNPSAFSRKGSGRSRVLDIPDEELKLFPVDNVSWEDAQEFVRRLNGLERGRGYLYRLPSEAEWEYACRGGATTEAECSFHFYFATPTNDMTSDRANFDGRFPVGTAPKGPFLWRPTRVGAYPPNKLGLCDMHGNVWQWCDDGTRTGANQYARGGNWGSGGVQCRAAHRSAIYPSYRDSSRGFRLVRVPVR